MSVNNNYFHLLYSNSIVQFLSSLNNNVWLWNCVLFLVNWPSVFLGQSALDNYYNSGCTEIYTDPLYRDNGILYDLAFVGKPGGWISMNDAEGPVWNRQGGFSMRKPCISEGDHMHSNIALHAHLGSGRTSWEVEERRRKRRIESSSRVGGGDGSKFSQPYLYSHIHI